MSLFSVWLLSCSPVVVHMSKNCHHSFLIVAEVVCHQILPLCNFINRERLRSDFIQLEVKGQGIPEVLVVHEA